jgi:hypothetical protein
MAKQEPTTVTPEVAPVEPTRSVSGDFSNPTFIEWPFDQHGTTTLLRKEGVRAIGRVAGDPAKADVVMATLQCLAQHLKARLPDQQAAILQQAAAFAAHEDAAQALSLADARRNAERVKGALAVAEARVAELEGAEGGDK